MIQVYQPDIITKNWGREVVARNDENYALKILEFKAGSAGSKHKHLEKSESWYVLSGEFSLEMERHGEWIIWQIKAGDCIHIPRGCYHKVRARTDVRILEGSTPHSDGDVYRIDQSSGPKS